MESLTEADCRSTDAERPRREVQVVGVGPHDTVIVVNDRVSKPGAVEVAGTVRELLPNAMFRVELDTRDQVLAHASGSVGRNFLRLLAGDRVMVELSPFDPGRGRIVSRV